jgi:hypothetical protein
MSIILLILLLIGIAFLLVPEKYLVKSPHSVLHKQELEISTVKGVVLFVSELKPDQSLENLLAFKVLNQISQSNPNQYNRRYVWLIHGGVLEQPNSSFNNANSLIATFSSSNLEVMSRNASDVNDPSDSFRVVEEVFTFDVPRYGLGQLDIVCDFTGGTKAMSIGMALACIGRRRLIYLPQHGSSDNSKSFLEIDSKSLLHSIIASD